MKVLGRGWQYTTYDLRNGRVLKKYNSLLKGWAIIFIDQLRYKGGSIWKVPGFYKGCKKKAIRSMEIISRGMVDPWMMGNPTLLNALDYEQDKVIPLHDCIKTVDTEEGKRLVDRFVSFNKILLERSVIDKSFNITKNFGLTADKRIILIDLGELYADPLAIKEQIKKRPWTARYVAEVIHNPEVRTYYVEQMDKNFVTEA